MLRLRLVSMTKSSGRIEALWVLREALLTDFQARTIVRSRYLVHDMLMQRVS